MFTKGKEYERAEASRVNAVTLAFLGDAVYTLFVREALVKSNSGKTSSLHRASVCLLSAKGQSAFLDKVSSLFTQEEEEVYRRGRNAKKPTKSKNASVVEYARSTGFEAVLGYLYLLGDLERISYLLSFIEEEQLKGQDAVKAYKP